LPPEDSIVEREDEAVENTRVGLEHLNLQLRQDPTSTRGNDSPEQSAPPLELLEVVELENAAIRNKQSPKKGCCCPGCGIM
jgi:hypothetical protein